MFKFEVGEKVKITNNNECYVDDPRMVADHVCDPYDAACYCMSSQPEDGDVGEVIARWEDNGQTIYYIRMYEDYDCDALSCYCYLVDEDGLKSCECNIKVGDRVRLVDGGELFPTYADWVVKHIEDKNLVARWAYGGRITDNSIGTTYEVVHIAPHGDAYGNIPLAFIKALDGIGYKCFLVAVSGLEKVKPEANKNKEWVF